MASGDPRTWTRAAQETVDPEMRGLRDIYETLLDLFTEIVVTDGKPYSHVTICLELWKFDNRKRGALRRGLAGIAEDAEYPSLVGSLQFVRTLQLALVAPRDAPAEDPRLRLRRYLRRLLIREGSSDDISCVRGCLGAPVPDGQPTRTSSSNFHCAIHACSGSTPRPAKSTKAATGKSRTWQTLYVPD